MTKKSIKKTYKRNMRKMKIVKIVTRTLSFYEGEPTLGYFRIILT